MPRVISNEELARLRGRGAKVSENLRPPPPPVTVNVPPQTEQADAIRQLADAVLNKNAPVSWTFEVVNRDRLGFIRTIRATPEASGD